MMIDGYTMDILLQNRVKRESTSCEPHAEPKKEGPWNAIRTMLNELERKQEKLYADYCDATARLKAIDKIAKSSQTPKQKIEGIWPLAQQPDELLKEYPEIKEELEEDHAQPNIR